MKKQIFFLMATLVFSVQPLISSAQGIFLFEVTAPKQVSAGKIVIENSNVTTPINFEIIATTLTDETTQEPFFCDMVITLLYEKNGLIEEISNPIPIAHSLFLKPYMRTNVLKFNAVLPANRMGGFIKLKYSYISWTTRQRIIDYSRASFQTIAPPVVPPAAPIDWNNPANANFISVSALGRNIFNAGTTVLRNGVYHLEFQSDGNLVLYNGTTPIWASGRRRGNNSTQVRFLPSGIGCYEGNTNYFWAGWNFELPGAIWVLQGDGNFVCYGNHTTDSNGVIIPNYGYPVGATMTQGGQKSNRSGRIT